MVTEFKYEVPAALQAYLSTDLDSLPNNDTFVGAKIDNVADGENEMYIALELLVAAQGSARSAGGYVAVYLLPSVDDTNFGYGDDAYLTDPGNLLCTFALDAATTARYVTRANLPIPPVDFKLQVQNKTGQAFASSGNTLKYRLYSLEAQ
jgi:hypothetical protein